MVIMAFPLSFHHSLLQAPRGSAQAILLIRLLLRRSRRVNCLSSRDRPHHPSKNTGHERADVLGLPKAAHGVLWRSPSFLNFKLRALNARRVRTLRFGSTGTERSSGFSWGRTLLMSTRVKPSDTLFYAT